MQPHISLAAERIGSFLGLPITNSILATWMVMVFLIIFTYFATKNLTLIPSTLQSIAEILIEGIHDLFTSIVGEHSIGQFFPLLATIFIFVMIANWSGLIPGVGSIGLTKIAAEETKIENSPASNNAKPVSEKSEFVPLFRGPTADLNTTLAIALIAVVALQYYGFKALGLSYLKKYLNFSNPINFFLGLLEIISELAKVISFAFRLFGNIFAGEVLLTVIAFLMPLIAPLPFLGLELFVGFIQALVFSMLTAVFLNLATISHAEH